MENKKALVIGDIMIDEWVYGCVNRISPEAPVPIFDVKSSTINLGGAGNLLVNLKAMGIDPIIITGVSEDKEGHLIKKMIRDLCGEDQFYFNIPKSFKKKRICSGQQQIVRIDTGKSEDISNVEVNEYFDRLKGKVNIVMISDYGKGSITKYLLRKASEFSEQELIPLIIDPYQRKYYNTIFSSDLIKFNKKEAEWFSGIEYTKEEDLKTIGHCLLSIFNTGSIIITLGPDGIVYFNRNEFYNNPYRKADNPLVIYDVSGAGDVVFSSIAVSMIENMEVKKMVDYAAKAGKIGVSKKGISIVNRDELFGE